MYGRIMFACVGVIAAAIPAQAATYTVFDDFDKGVANFNKTVTDSGATVKALSLPSGSNGVYADFTITRPNGNSVSVGSPYYLYNSSPGRYTSGGVVDIAPSGSSRGIGAKESGITFTFKSAINALGFEVGDWATCCQPSDLYIQFGNSAAIKVGESKEIGDQYLTNGGAGVFVGAFDNSDTFTSVTFWGDGFGEALYAGGTIRYANIGKDTPLPGVPEPASWAMMLMGFGTIGGALRRHRRASVRFA